MEQTNQTENKKRRKWLWWLLLLAVLAGGLGYYFYQSKEAVPLISADLLPESGDATDQRLSERAQEIADANYFTLQINPEAIFEARDPSKSLIQAPMCTQSPWISLYCRAGKSSILPVRSIQINLLKMSPWRHHWQKASILPKPPSIFTTLKAKKNKGSLKLN